MHPQDSQNSEIPETISVGWQAEWQMIRRARRFLKRHRHASQIPMPPIDERETTEAAREAVRHPERATAIAERHRKAYEGRCDVTLRGVRLQAGAILGEVGKELPAVAATRTAQARAAARIDPTMQVVSDPNQRPWTTHHMVLIPVLIATAIFCVFLGYRALSFFATNSGLVEPDSAWIFASCSILAVLSLELYGLTLHTVQELGRFLKNLTIGSVGCLLVWAVTMAYLNRGMFEDPGASFGSTVATNSTPTVIGVIQLSLQVIGEILGAAAALTGVSYLFTLHGGLKTIYSPEFVEAQRQLAETDRVLKGLTGAHGDLDAFTGTLNRTVFAATTTAIVALEKAIRHLERLALLGDDDATPADDEGEGKMPPSDKPRDDGPSSPFDPPEDDYPSNQAA